MGYCSGSLINGSVFNMATNCNNSSSDKSAKTSPISSVSFSSTEDITINFPNNEETAHRIANLTRQYQRNVLANKDDNQVVSWGTVEFTRVSGVKVTKTVTVENPLVFKASCHHIVSGTVSIVTSNNRNWTINYGTGECDNIAILTINGKTKEIKIR